MQSRVCGAEEYMRVEIRDKSTGDKWMWALAGYSDDEQRVVFGRLHNPHMDLKAVPGK